MTNSWLLPAIAVTGAAGGVVAALLPRPARAAVSAIATGLVAALGIAAAALVLSHSASVDFHSAAILPLSGVSLSLDPLGALFSGVVSAVSLVGAAFAGGYGGPAMSQRVSAGAMPAFVAAMVLVPAAGSVGTFMVLWELMAITSLALVLADHARRPDVAGAGLWYGAMTQLGAAAILIALVLVAAHVGSQDFGAMRARGPSVSGAVGDTAFLLAVVGFGSKAGVVPLHVWLPRAHPAAPGPVSVLMSAGMVNLGVYGIVRIGRDVLGGGPWWWWTVVMAIGAVSALYGALQSATDTDLKRLLAHSTIDNMGLVLVGVGASGLLASVGNRGLALVALIAALVHLIAHAAFKGALFMAVSSVQQAAGTTDIDKLGGLLRAMPATGSTFVVAGAAMSALPPLAGFVGEWLLLQSLLHGVSASNVSLAVMMPIGVAVLALTGGLTAVAFVKAFGIGMLGRPRGDGAADAVEVPTKMWLPAVFFAAVTVAIGVAPFLVIPMARTAAKSLVGVALPSPVVSGWRVGVAGVHGTVFPGLIGLAIVVVCGGAIVVRRALQRGPVRVTDAWGCGRLEATRRMQYTATSYAEPLVRVFDEVLRPDTRLDITHAAESEFFVTSITYETRREDVIERNLYRPVEAALRRWGDVARRIQNGSVHRYVAFGLVALIAIVVTVG